MNRLDLQLDQSPVYLTPETMPDLTCAEFFAGIGLMRMGLERHNWSIVFANDIDPQKEKMYRDQFPDEPSHLVPGDIHKLPADCVPTTLLATASFPCNDLSLAGARQGLDGSESSAFWGFIRILREMTLRRPPVILLENVTGFLNSHGGADITQALLAMNDLGYAVDLLMIDAARFVPQSRQRLFVIGVRRPDPCVTDRHFTLGFYESDARPKAVSAFIFTHPEINWNLRPLPALPQRTVNLEHILEDLPEDASEWWNRERVDYLLSQMSARHRDIADQMIVGATYSYGTVFRRIRNQRSTAELRTDGIAGCLRTPRGGSGRQILFRGGHGNSAARLLTPRECARLMGANEFKIAVPLNQALFGFGDAVCVPVIAWLAQHYLNPLIEELFCKSATKGEAKLS